MKVGMVISNEFVTDPRPLNEARILAKNGIEVFVLCYDHGAAPPFDEPNITLERIPLSKGKANRLYALNNTLPGFRKLWSERIKAFVSKFNLDALHVHDLYMAEPALSVKKQINIPIVVDLHEYYPEAIKSYRWAQKFPNRLVVRPYIYAQKEQRLLMGVDRIIVLSETFRDHLCKKYPKLDKTKFIEYPNVPDIDRLSSYPTDRKLFKRDEDDFVLFYFGAIAERRGMYICFEALALLKEQIPKVKFLLVGPIDKNEEEAMRTAMSDPKIKEHIIYKEWCDISDLPSLITASDVCISPIENNAQHASGVANKIFQYMLFGKPLLVSNCPPQKLVVEENECGLAYRWDDAEELSEKALLLFNDTTKRGIMSANGKRAVLSKFSIDNYGKKLSLMYITIAAPIN